MSRVLVIGGGISGLTAAHSLLNAGHDVTVLESSTRLGGCVSTSTLGTCRFEDGPNSVQGRAPEFRALCAELGLTEKLVPASDQSSNRHLYFRGRLHKLPSSLKEFLKTPLLTAPQKLRALLWRFRRTRPADHEETVAEFFGRRIGRGVTMTLVDVVVTGTFAGSPNRIGMESAFPELVRMDRQYGNLLRALSLRAAESRLAGTKKEPAMLSLQGGLGTLIAALQQRLGPRAHLGMKASSMVRRPDGGYGVLAHDAAGAAREFVADRAVLALPAPQAGMLLAPLAPEAADLLFEVEYASLAVAQAVFAEDALPGLPRGFGFLVPRCMRMRTLGWMSTSHVFPEVAPQGLVTLTGFIGGVLDPQATNMDDAQLRHLMLGELALALRQRRTPQPQHFRIVRWNDVLPQLTVGHARRLQIVRDFIASGVPGVSIAGNWTTGPSLERCITSGRAAATEIGPAS